MHPRSEVWQLDQGHANIRDNMSATHQYSDGQRMMIEDYRVYYGDGGEEIDSRFVTGLVNRQVRE